MAIYRFRVSFEDYEDIYRDIDVSSKSTFLDLHKAIHSSTGYEAERSSSFYVSNDQWKKGTEIAYLPSSRKKAAEVLEMGNLRLSKFIEDPHQKFYYVYNFDRPYDIHVELVKILKEEDGKAYPAIYRSVGQAPKSAAAANFPIGDELDDEDDVEVSDVNTEEYGVDEDDEYGLYDDNQEGETDGSDSAGQEDSY